MLGSIMSRAINGSAPLIPTLLAGVVLVGLHWLLGVLSHRSHRFGRLVKGDPVPLIADGVVRQDGIREAGLSRRDLEQAMP